MSTACNAVLLAVAWVTLEAVASKPTDGAGDHAEPPGAYNQSEALFYAQYARASFCNRRALEAWMCGEPCDAVPTPSAVKVLGPGPIRRVQGLVAQVAEAVKAEQGRRCVVAFRGTTNTANWFADADAIMVPLLGNSSWCSGCLVHEGFAQAYGELRAELLAAIQELGCIQVGVTGHSLGAAVATLATMELRGALKIPTNPLITFGSPRVGDANFAREFRIKAGAQGLDIPSWRLVHYHDPVPRLAPAVKVNGHVYTHVPREVYYSKYSASHRVCDPSGEDYSCADSVSLFGCINLEHLLYLNLTFRHTELPQECQHPARFLEPSVGRT